MKFAKCGGTAREPVAVLGSTAAQRLGIDRLYPDQRIWLGGQWFNVGVVGVLAGAAATAVYAGAQSWAVVIPSRLVGRRAPA